MKRQLQLACNAESNKKVKVSGLTSSNNDNTPTTSKTLTEAEKTARRAEYNKNYRQQIKEQLQKQQQNQQLDVTLNETSNKLPQSQTIITEAEKRAKHAEYNGQCRQRSKEKQSIYAFLCFVQNTKSCSFFSYTCSWGNMSQMVQESGTKSVRCYLWVMLMCSGINTIN
jgi:ABC-type oligopeptide transport system substrate-binding subunit